MLRNDHLVRNPFPNPSQIIIWKEIPPQILPNPFPIPSQPFPSPSRSTRAVQNPMLRSRPRGAKLIIIPHQILPKSSFGMESLPNSIPNHHLGRNPSPNPSQIIIWEGIPSRIHPKSSFGKDSLPKSFPKHHLGRYPFQNPS